MGGGGGVVKPVASHIAPAQRCQVPYIVGLPLPSLTRFKAVRPRSKKTISDWDMGLPVFYCKILRCKNMIERIERD